MKETWKTIKKLFSSHYALERFGILFISLVVCMGILMTSISIKVYKDNKITLSEQVAYTSSVTTSLTGQNGNIIGIYHSTDRKKCFVLIKFEDMASLSINAEYYQMFVTGFTPMQQNVKLKTMPLGCIYIFGSTGYMGLYFTSSGGFAKQIMGVTVRCNKTIVDTALSDASSTYMDASFDSYDQFRFYFNPGGSATKTAKSLDKSRVNIFELYEELVTKPNEENIREQLNDDLKEMYTKQTAISEYKERLAREGISSYIIPKQIDGDRVELNGKGVYQFKTNYIIPKGVNFDWYDGSIKKGYLDTLKGNLSYTEYFDKLEQEEITDADEFSTETTWYMTDGTSIKTDETDTLNLDDASSKELLGAIDLLTNAWQDFYTLKEQYQCTDLVSLLKLEKEAREAQSHYTINTNLNALQTY